MKTETTNINVIADESLNDAVINYWNEIANDEEKSYMLSFKRGANWQQKKDADTIDKLIEVLEEGLDQLESFNQESEPTFTMRRISELIQKFKNNKQ